MFSTSGPSYWREGPGTLKARDYKDGHDAGLVLDNHGAYPLAFRSTDGLDMQVLNNISPTVKVGSGIGIPSPPAILEAHAPAVAYSTKMHNTKSNQSGKLYREYTPGLHHNPPPPALLQSIPRRLTPRECERLQGFPDGWTNVDGMKDGPRYRMMGNAVTVNVVEWIAKRIKEAH